jgi:hypothetical protein
MGFNMFTYAKNFQQPNNVIISIDLTHPLCNPFNDFVNLTCHDCVTPWDPSLLFSASQLLWERGDIVPGLYLILA